MSGDYKKQGLFQRYHYERSDGKPLDPEEQLFALRYDKDDPWGEICRQTLKEFADRAQIIGYAVLADDLRERIRKAEEKIQAERTLTPTPVPQI